MSQAEEDSRAIDPRTRRRFDEIEAPIGALRMALASGASLETLAWKLAEAHRAADLASNDSEAFCDRELGGLLPLRIANTLEKAGVVTIGDALAMSPDELAEVPQIGVGYALTVLMTLLRAALAEIHRRETMEVADALLDAVGTHPYRPDSRGIRRPARGA